MVSCLWIATVQVQIFGNPLVAIQPVEATNSILVIGVQYFHLQIHCYPQCHMVAIPVSL